MLMIAKSLQGLDLLQIGSVADRSDVPIKIIRYYEEFSSLKSLLKLTKSRLKMG